MAYTVAVFLVDKAYGGPEEGGWWYDCGTPSEEHAAKTRGFENEDEADRYAAELNGGAFIAELNDGRPPVSSVASIGCYEAVVQEGNPACFPAERPQYE